MCASVGLIKKCFDTVDARCKPEDYRILYYDTISHVYNTLRLKRRTTLLTLKNN